MQCIITSDGIWVYEFNIQTNQQASEWRTIDEPKLKNHVKFIQNSRLCSLFFHICGLVNHEFVPSAQSTIYPY